MKSATPRIANRDESDPRQVWQIEVNLDDTSPEILGAACDRVRAAGALDAYLTPIQMKKNRPGVQMTVLVSATDLAAVETSIFDETTTFGLRRFIVERTVLERGHVPVETPWGEVRIKEGRRGAEIVTAAPEYDDCLRVAEEAGVPLRRVYEAAQRSYFAD